MGVHFESVQPANLSGTSDWTGLELYFRRVADPPPSDPEVENLRRRYEDAVQKLHFVARTEGEFLKIFNTINGSAVSSLATPGGAVQDGSDKMKEIEITILDLARSRRRGYFLWILAIGCLTSVLGLVLWAVSALIPKLLPLAAWGYFDSYSSALSWLIPACLILPGASLGIVFVGFATNKLLKYDNVGRMDQYDFVPWERFVWVMLIAYVLLAALWFNLFVLGVGNIELNKVTEESKYGFLIGLVCGLAEALVAELLISRLQPVVR